MPDAQTTHDNLLESGLHLVVRVVLFHLRLLGPSPMRFERDIDRIEQPGGPQVVDPGQVAAAGQPEMGQEARRRGV